MVIKCPGCGKNLEVPEEYVGRRVKCPECQRIFTVPQLPPPSRQDASGSEINSDELQKIVSKLSEERQKNASESSQGRTDSPNQPADDSQPVSGTSDETSDESAEDAQELSFPMFADTEGGRVADSLLALGGVVAFLAVILGIGQIIAAIVIFSGDEHLDPHVLWPLGLALLVGGLAWILAGSFIYWFCRWLACILKYVRKLWVLNVRMSEARGNTTDVVDPQYG